MKPSQLKTAFFIALRYLFSKKKHNIINVISLVSMLGIMVSSAALIVVLSVFNGMGDMIEGWFNAFNPDFEITLAEGKSFLVDSFPKDKIASLDGVLYIDEVVSDMVLATYGEQQELIRLKGVDKTYLMRKHYDNLLIDGRLEYYIGEQPCAIVGAIAAGKLRVNLNSFDLMSLYYPKRTKKNLANSAEAFTTRHLFTTGVFNTNTDNDATFVFCPIDFTRDLMQYQGEATSVEVQLRNSADYLKCQEQISQIVGPEFKVRNKYEQEESLFKTLQSEKFMIYVILAFILLVAAFNIIGSLGMLIMEKKSDTAILQCLGAEKSFVQRIFIYEGMMISFFGGLLGMLVGAVICLLQQTFHIVKLGNGSSGYLIDYYPVQMHFLDFVLVLVTILVISLLTSILPAAKFKKTTIQKDLL